MHSVFYSFPYIFVFILLFILSVPLYTRGPNKLVNNFWQYYSVFFLLFVFIGLRGFIFTDWKAYYTFFSELPSLFDGNNAINSFFSHSKFSIYEKGFSLFSILLKTISSNYFFYQSVSFLIDFIILFLCFKHYVPKHILLCFVFFYVFNGVIGLGIQINFLRNAKALMFFLISIKYLQEKRIIPYFVLNVIGCFFHISSVLYLPLYFLLCKRFRLRFYIVIFIIGNIIYLSQIQYLSSILQFFGNAFSGHISHIVNRYIDNVRWNSSYGISIGYLERIFTFIFVLCFSHQLYKKSSNIIFVNILFMYVLSYLFCSELRILTDRIPLLFAFSYWVIYPQI